MKKNILISGGAGFIGSNFLQYFSQKYPEYHLYNIDKLTYAGDVKNLKELEDVKTYTFLKEDICDRKVIEDIFNKYQITDVIHFAAESHVDNSIEGPEAFIQTNINGTFTLLDVARKFWMDSPSNYKNEFKNSLFHHISTDEVYGQLGKEGFFTEETSYAPNSPYSASKASSDMIVRSYFHTYGMNSVITNCSNNYGPKQNSEKLIPTIIRKALSQSPIPVYGDGSNIRDWLYVEDHCRAIDMVFHSGKSGETYCVGGNCEKKNIDIVNEICKILDELKPLKDKKYSDFITYVTDRPGHDFRYAIDTTKIEKELSWQAQETFETGIMKTIKWYLDE
tara:strand:+ start:100931 stop:101938 length:1008 start_codon:yes stop_codon:yes gene_type:complete